MSDFYDCKIIEKNDKKVRLRVISIHPDLKSLVDGKTFAFLLLCEPLVNWKTGKKSQMLPATLRRFVGPGDTSNEPYITYFAPAIIDSVDTKLLQDGSCEYVITVTDKRWVDHISVGLEFSSTAYNVKSSFNREHKPSTPDDFKEVVRAQNQKLGFTTLNKSDIRLKIDLPCQKIYVTTYSPRRYISGDEVMPKDMLGQVVVIIMTTNEKRIGTIISIDQNTLGLFSRSTDNSSQLLNNLRMQDIRLICKAVLVDDPTEFDTYYEC